MQATQWIGAPAATPRVPTPWSIALALLLALATAVLASGCGDESTVTVPLTAPAVLDVTPADGSTGVLRNSVIAVQFASPMEQSSTESAFAITPVRPGSFAWSADGTELAFLPTGLLDGGMEYIITLDGGALDRSGQALGAPVAAYFVTEDDLPPLVDGTVPESGETMVAVNLNVRITFTEPMDPVTTAAAIRFNPVASGTVSFSPDGTVATFTPGPAFAAFTDYTVTVGTGATEVGGTPMDAPFSFRFSTDDHSL